jgi:hypothetical protein
MKKTVLNTAIAASLGFAVAAPVNAAVVNATWTGYFTMLKPDGGGFQNTAPSQIYSSPFYGFRTPITGTFSFNTTTGAGTATVAGFSFGGGGIALASSITMQAIGDGNCTSSGCGPGTLVLGNMGFTWGPNTAIAVSIVLDAAGFFGATALPGFGTSTTIDNVGAFAASENTKFGGATFGSSILMTMGAMPMATTEFNTTFTGNTTGCSWSACNPSGTLPLVTDTVTDSREDTVYIAGDKKGVGGSPMLSGPFPGYNANFDVDTIHITSVVPDSQPVPVPAAVWLFGSGLLGLVGIARRKKKA